MILWPPAFFMLEGPRAPGPILVRIEGGGARGYGPPKGQKGGGGKVSFGPPLGKNY